ncbi:hypothetical protein [Haloarcula marina]|uniref:hypothetical protein n=1 Tax=Haloarcula marina TaxID=2961574 RepID=UPI0020B6A9BC|nr:hypothetical protein [Halomicroarcula marina]
MSLQIGAALRDAGLQLVSRTGAILFALYLVLMLGIQSAMNTVFAVVYTRMGFEEVTAALPFVLDVPLSVAGALVAVGAILGSYLSLVATRTFVADARDDFPTGAFTRNVPLALVNLFVGGFVYSALVFVGSLLLVVPGIIAYIAFLFMVPYVAVEDRNFVDALRSSYGLSKGNWLALFGLMVLLVAVFGFVGAVAGVLGTLLLPQGLSQLAITVLQAPASLFSLAVIAAAFRQLRDGETQSPSAESGTDAASTAL